MGRNEARTSPPGIQRNISTDIRSYSFKGASISLDSHAGASVHRGTVEASEVGAVSGVSSGTQ